MKIPKHCFNFHNLAIAIFSTVAFYPNSVNAQIIPDATLPNNSSIRTENNIKFIEGGSQAGENLFHSFEQFSVPTNSTAYFNNLGNIQNIITRITGKSISNIDGILRANGEANLFLINPNGIIFGENAALDIGGSFLATTASSINFADGTKFSATQPKTAPLLTINVPIGLQFGATAAPIRNQSQASAHEATNSFRQSVGLQVPTSKTLALIGGDVILEDGNLTADSGRIELGSVTGNSAVSLNSIDEDWAFGYESVENFQNIQLTQPNIDDSTIGSIVDVSGEDGGGNILVQGNYVELIDSYLNAGTRSDSDAGDLTINAKKLIVRNGAQIITGTLGKGRAGNLTINASDSVELIGGNFTPSLLSSNTSGDGEGGNININTSRLLISDGAGVSVATSGKSTLDNSQFILATGKGGNLTVNASEFVEIAGKSGSFKSQLASTTSNSANAGELNIYTKQLIIRDGAEISVSSKPPELPPNLTVVGDINNLGNAGILNITADSILLDNQGKFISEAQSANGGNINLQLKDLLLMRRNSQISTNAGIAQLNGDGGNININIPDGFIVAVLSENSDITANAFTGSGGRVDINATGIFGIQPRSRDQLAELLASNNPRELNPQKLPTSDITAISRANPNLNGILNVNATDVEPVRELMELQDIPVDTKVSQVCRFRRGNQSEFVYTRSGGLPPLPGELLGSESVLSIDWVSSEIEEKQGEEETKERFSIQNRIIHNSKYPRLTPSNNKTRLRKFGPMKTSIAKLEQNRIVEATGWIVDQNGDIYFVAGKPNPTGDNSKGVGC